MIYKYKLYRTLDHWEYISSFYERKIRRWISEENLVSKQDITLNDLLLTEKIARSTDSDYLNFKEYTVSINKNMGTYGIDHSSAFFLGTKSTLGICLDTTKITDSISFKENFAIFVAIVDTFRFFKYYLRESGLFTTLTSQFKNLVISNKVNKYLEEHNIPCEACLMSVYNLLLLDLDSTKDIEKYYLEKSVLCSYQKNCYDHRINNFLNTLIYLYQQLINKELEVVDLTLKKVIRSELMKPIEYSKKYNFAIIPRFFNDFTSEELSDITVAFKNSLGHLLVYKNRKLYCYWRRAR